MNAIALVDLDGTLVDSIPAQRLAWGKWAEERGLSAEPFIQTHGWTAARKIGTLAPHLDVAHEVPIIAALEEAELGSIRALPGAEELWQSSARLAVVSSGTRALVEARLRAARLSPSRPEAIVTAEDVSRGKPDAEPYRLAADCLGVHPAECTAIEDAPDGVRSAVAAGCGLVIGVTTTTGARELEQAGAGWLVRDIGAYLAQISTGACRGRTPVDGGRYRQGAGVVGACEHRQK
jgi:sugar-phosphatase